MLSAAGRLVRLHGAEMSRPGPSATGWSWASPHSAWLVPLRRWGRRAPERPRRWAAWLTTSASRGRLARHILQPARGEV